jgi:prepilin-type processing-associated H-X9-DG protein
VCPSAAVDTSTTPNRKPTSTPSYGYNNVFGGEFNYKTSYGVPSYGVPSGSISISAINRAAEVIMVLDYYDPGATTATTMKHMDWFVNADPNVRNRVIPHLEGGNIAYADGHVKWIPGAKFNMSYSDTTGQCDPRNPSAAKAFCDRGWNPFVQ